MSPWANLIFFVARTLEGLLNIYFWIVIIAALLTWIEPNPYNPIVRFLYSVTEPVFDWVREHLPVFFGGIDFSPLVVIIAIQFVQVWLIPTILHVLVPGYA
ncbi:MAG TPA: YggT family protein [Candidatus Binataceae bacterium]|nr:YggT family protein [Candidatus Binataceae bacterium]